MTLALCNERERAFFADLWAEYEVGKAQHETARSNVALAFTAFCNAHDLPDGTVINGVGPDGLIVTLPSVQSAPEPTREPAPAPQPLAGWTASSPVTHGPH